MTRAALVTAAAVALELKRNSNSCITVKFICLMAAAERKLYIYKDRMNPAQEE